MDGYVVAPTAEAWGRMDGSPVSATAGDVAMARRAEAWTSEDAGREADDEPITS